MAFDNEPMVLTEEPSFRAVLDTACDRLQEKHVQYSLRRLREMDEELELLERELDQFIGQFACGHNAEKPLNRQG